MLFHTGGIPEYKIKEDLKMRIKLYFETLEGEKKYVSTEMRNVMGGRTYYDFVATFNRYDHKIKEDFIVVIFNDDNKIIHKENIHIHWVTNSKETIWNYGITMCGERVVSNISYGKTLPVCCNDRKRTYVDVQKYENGKPVYDKYGLPVMEKQYNNNDKKIKEVSSNEFPKGVLHALSKINYNV